MERLLYYKLIRDRIPEIIEQDGREYEILVMTEDEYRVALANKLGEEVQEVLEAASRDVGSLPKELADLYEVIDSLVSAFDLNEESIREIQRERRVKRGGFEKRLKLLWTD